MGHIDKHRITLSPEHTSLIEDVVAAGEFASASAVVEEALQEWKERRDNFGYTLAELRGHVQAGIDSGPARDGGPVMERLLARYRAQAGAR